MTEYFLFVVLCSIIGSCKLTWSAGQISFPCDIFSDLSLCLCYEALSLITRSIALTLLQWGQFVCLFENHQLWFLKGCVLCIFIVAKAWDDRYWKVVSICWLVCSKWDDYFYLVVPYTFVYLYLQSLHSLPIIIALQTLPSIYSSILLAYFYNIVQCIDYLITIYRN